MNASSGHYVDSNASTSQTECATGSFQPPQGQSMCLDAEPGYHVPNNASDFQTACLSRELSEHFWTGNCVLADIGFFADGFGSDSQTLQRVQLYPYEWFFELRCILTLIGTCFLILSMGTTMGRFRRRLDDFLPDGTEWLDTDGDGTGDNTDEDIDGDGENEFDDLLQFDSDHDSDGIGI